MATLSETTEGGYNLLMSPAEWHGLRRFMKDYLAVRIDYRTYTLLQELTGTYDPREYRLVHEDQEPADNPPNC